MRQFQQKDGTLVEVGSHDDHKQRLYEALQKGSVIAPSPGGHKIGSVAFKRFTALDDALKSAPDGVLIDADGGEYHYVKPIPTKSHSVEGYQDPDKARTYKSKSFTIRADATEAAILEAAYVAGDGLGFTPGQVFYVNGNPQIFRPAPDQQVKFYAYTTRKTPYKNADFTARRDTLLATLQTIVEEKLNLKTGDTYRIQTLSGLKAESTAVAGGTGQEFTVGPKLITYVFKLSTSHYDQGNPVKFQATEGTALSVLYAAGCDAYSNRHSSKYGGDHLPGSDFTYHLETEDKKILVTGKGRTMDAPAVAGSWTFRITEAGTQRRVTFTPTDPLDVEKTWLQGGKAYRDKFGYNYPVSSVQYLLDDANGKTVKKDIWRL